MRELCREKGIELILVKAPTNSWMYWWHNAREEQIRRYAEEHSLAYYNFIPLAEEIGIDWSTDTYDAGAHLNVYGAEKLTDYFGGILQNDHAISDRRADTALSSAWTPRVEAYYKDKNK